MATPEDFFGCHGQEVLGGSNLPPTSHGGIGDDGLGPPPPPNSRRKRRLRKMVWSDSDYTWTETLIRHYVQTTLPLLHDEVGLEARIPKKIHFIWLGPKSIPTYPHVQAKRREESDDDSEIGTIPWNEAMKSWTHHHSKPNDWSIDVWTDANVKNLHPPLTNQAAFDHAMNVESYGMASDILRLELLHRFGGVYVDVDYLCTGSVSDLHRQFDFYCGASNTGCIEVNNGLMGSASGHWIVAKMMTEIGEWFESSKDAEKGSAAFDTNSAAPPSLLASFLDDKSTAALHTVSETKKNIAPMEVIRHTGPGLITRTLIRAFESREKQGGAADGADAHAFERLAILPFTFFHPFPNHLREALIDGKSTIDEFAVPGETKAIHLWGCSWQG